MADSDSSFQTSLDLPSDLQGQLEYFQKRVWRVKIAEGLLAGVFGLLVSYLVVFGLDRFFDTPGWLRMVILLVGTLGLSLFFPLKFHHWVWKRRSLEQVARLLRVKFPHLGDELLGIVELAKRGGDGTASQALVHAAMKQANERVKMEDFSDAVPAAKNRTWAIAAGVVGMVALLALLMVPRASWNAVARWVLPMSDTARYTFAQVDGLPDKLVVPLAEPYVVRASLAEGTEWSPAKGLVRVGDRPAVETALSDTEYTFSLPAQSTDDKMKVRIGDKRETIPIVPMPRPELREILAELQLPDYLGYSTKPRIPMQGGTVPVVKGAIAKLEATATRNLAEATIDGEPLTLEGATIRTKPIRIKESSEHEITWRDEHGLSAKSPLILKVKAVDDDAPGITARQTTAEQIVLATESIKFELDANDDFGVKEIGLEWTGVPDPKHNPSPAQGDKIVSAGGFEKRTIDSEATFSADRENIAPQTLKVRAFATDYRPGRPRSYSPEFTLHVLSPEDHAIWITQEFGKWFRQAQEVYEREQQLHAINQDIRDLDADELDRPENRRLIEKQAAGEAANGKRLAAMTQAGNKLVEHATRNEEFDAERLETWATLLQELDNIAKDRMPSVADLLKKSANAAGTPSQRAPKVGENRDPRVADANDKKPGAPKKTTPSISDRESSMMPNLPKAPDDKKAKEATDESEKPKPGKFGLPTTQLAAVDTGEEKEEEKKSDAQQKVSEAVDAQEDLLAEFERVRDQLSDLLGSLEASTFVKRFKAASRKQLEIASDLNRALISAFGLSDAAIKETKQKRAALIADREAGQSETVSIIQDDLEAYFNRKQDARYKTIMDEMRETAVAAELREIGETVRVNFNGRSIVAAEFWADTLDRWGEQLVSASSCSSCSSCSGDSLPPQVVLKVIKLLHEEMALRDETRETESAKPALDPEQFDKRANALSRTQVIMEARIADVIDEVRDLENGETRFKKEIALLTQAGRIMEEASNILATPDTSGPAVAAETEVIELLLQAKRNKPGSSGGGGGANPGNGGQGTTSSAALANLGPGNDAEATIEDRDVGQSTGTAGRELPEEFRAGLDAYFNALETGK